MKRAEVIIACRGELVGNLERTVNNVINTLSPRDGVCVVFDGAQEVEYNLPKRVRVLKPWDQARGCGQARHAGITTSDAEIVVLIDGHMQFDKGWVKTTCDHLRDNPRDLTCCKMQSLNHKWEPMEGQGGYCGAYLTTKTQEPGNQFWALSAKWLPQGGRAGVVPAIMGACYGMRKEWYANMGEPLHLLEAWGGDEELLSLCSWMMGGRVYCLPVTVGHIYAAPYVRTTDRVQKKAEQAEIWANRHAILNAIPMAFFQRDELLEWMQGNRIDHDAVKKCVEARQDRIEALNVKLESALAITEKPCDWEQLAKAQIVRGVMQASKKPDLVKADVARNMPAQPVKRTLSPKPNTCPMCDWPGIGAMCKRCGHRVRDVHVVKSLNSDRVFKNAVEYNDQLGYYKRSIPRA